MSEKHSPTPWNAVVSVIDPEFMKILDSRGDSVAYEIASEDDAKHIVRCVNANDELVAALEDLISFVEPALESGVRIPGLATVNRAKAALSKAKETP